MPKLTTEEFIKRAQEKHKQIDGTPRFDYSNVIYDGLKGNIIITCQTHGDFTTSAFNHLNAKDYGGCFGCKPKSYMELLSITTGRAYTICGTNSSVTYKNGIKTVNKY